MTTDTKPTTNSNSNGEAHQSDALNGCIQMTMDEWKRTHRDFKTIDHGKRYALRLVPGKGTCLVPVEIVKKRA